MLFFLIKIDYLSNSEKSNKASISEEFKSVKKAAFEKLKK